MVVAVCIFTQPVASVDSTQIFARKTSRGSQFIVYQMNYESVGDNAMILPVPVRNPAQESSLRFIDLQRYPEFFGHLARGFPYRRSPFDISCSAGPRTRATLPLHEIGNYIASFVPRPSEFSRLDSRFTLPSETWSLFPQYADYGFAVFQLSAGSLSPHPMAFEFESSNDALYFPTVHIHDGVVHEWETFDHFLYAQHAGLDSRASGYQNFDTADEATGLVRSSDAAVHFCDVDRAQGILNGHLLVHQLRIDGSHLNRDTLIPVSGDPETPTINWRRWWSLSPVAIVAMAILWVLRRRSQLRAMPETGVRGTVDEQTSS